MFEPRHPSLKVVINYMAAPVRTPKREETEQWIEWFKERSDDATKGGNPPKGASPNADAALELPTAGIRGTLQEKRVAASILAFGRSLGLMQGDSKVWMQYRVRMILPQVHLRKPCYDFSFL